MMIIYLFHGGITSTPVEENRKFFTSLTQNIQANGTLLFIYFAKEREKWDELLSTDKDIIAKYRNDINIDVASLQKDTLISQIKNAQAIHIRGGDDLLLQERLLSIKDNLKELFDNKVVGGSSAGANLFSTYYYSTDREYIAEGFSLTPFKVICHYKDSLRTKAEELKTYGENLELLLLPEQAFISKTC